MKENTKNTIIQQVCNKGIPFFLISSILNYLAGKVWGFIWSNYTAVFILAIYIMIVLVGIYDSQSKPFLDLGRKELWFYQIIIPAISVILFACIAVENSGSQINSLGDVRSWLLNNDKIPMLIGVFFCIAIVTYFIAYENVKLRKRADEGCRFPNEVLEIQQNYENRLNGIYKKLEDVEAVLNEKSQVAYTATCIPIKYNKEHDSFALAMIKNLSHKESQWMFPGSHVEVSDNCVKEEFDLTDINIVPRKIIEDKVKKEAGLYDLQFIDPSFEKVSYENTANGREKRCYSNTCCPENAPVFNYLFRVSESAKCYKTKNHRCHYDFTYIGEYNEIDEKEAEYDVIEVEVNRKKDIKDMEYLDAIAYINASIGKQINNKLNSVKGKRRNKLSIPSDQLFLDSIPEMIYNAILFYSDYKGL